MTIYFAIFLFNDLCNLLMPRLEGKAIQRTSIILVDQHDISICINVVWMDGWIICAEFLCIIIC